MTEIECSIVPFLWTLSIILQVLTGERKEPRCSSRAQCRSGNTCRSRNLYNCVIFQCLLHITILSLLTEASLIFLLLYYADKFFTKYSSNSSFWSRGLIKYLCCLSRATWCTLHHQTVALPDSWIYWSLYLAVNIDPGMDFFVWVGGKCVDNLEPCRQDVNRVRDYSGSLVHIRLPLVRSIHWLEWNKISPWDWKSCNLPFPWGWSRSCWTHSLTHNWQRCGLNWCTWLRKCWKISFLSRFLSFVVNCFHCLVHTFS